MKDYRVDNAAINLFNRNKIQFIELISDRKIIFEHELDLSSVLIENCSDVFEKLLSKEGLNINLSVTCFLERGDTLYALYDSNEFDPKEAHKLTEKKYKDTH